MINLFIDMDGVIARWGGENGTYMEPGYFETLPKSETLTKTLLHLERDNVRLFILSKMTEGLTHMPYEKLTWLSNYPVQFDAIYFCPPNMNKAEFISQFGIPGVNVLLDDYNPNLDVWKEYGYVPIKFVNHVNSPHEEYYTVDEKDPSNLSDILEEIKRKSNV